MVSNLRGLRTVLSLENLKVIMSESVPKFKMNWPLICHGIKHEMDPKISSIIRKLIDTEDRKSDDDQNILNHEKIPFDDVENNVSKVIDYLKTKRLAIEERPSNN